MEFLEKRTLLAGFDGDTANEEMLFDEAIFAELVQPYLPGQQDCMLNFDLNAPPCSGQEVFKPIDFSNLLIEYQERVQASSENGEDESISLVDGV